MVHDLHGINLIALNRFGTLKYGAEHSLCWVVSFPIGLDVNIFPFGVDSPEPQVNEEKITREPQSLVLLFPFNRVHCPQW